MSSYILDIFKKNCSDIGEFEKNPEVAVACSGGIDSIALAHIAIKSKIFSRVVMLVVDHGLRKESLAQAQEVVKYWQNIEVEAILLSLNKFKGGNMLKWARDNRYNALANCCKNKQIINLLVAHNANDNAENFMIRLNRKSGINGLRYMEKVYYIKQIRIIRPIINIYREEIIKYHYSNSLPHWHDPSNDIIKYQRIKWRKMFNSKQGWNVKEINRISNACSQINQKIEEILNDVILHVNFEKESSFIDKDIFLKQETEIQRRIINKMILFVSGKNYPPKQKIIDKFLDNPSKKRSLGKCIAYIEHSRIWIKKAKQQK